jgi:protein-L-isoaspartate(D-aspartate) O-methyltransferase
MIQNNKAIHLAEQISNHLDIDSNLKEAFSSIDRDIFLPKGFSPYAHQLDALPMSAGQWISSPLTVAKMTYALDYKGADSVLEIGCGSGYQAAILSRLVRRVFTVERVESLLNEAKHRFNTLGLKNIHTRFNDGTKGWREYAPYDRILFSASCSTLPTMLFDQLKDGGILVAPIDKGNQQVITKYIKNGKKISAIEIEKCLFVPVVSGTIKSINN